MLIIMLTSETKEIQAYTFTHNNRTIHLIDTPGFDDTNRSDSEVLRDLAFYLTSSYDNGFRLTGIIYLHPITATRMTGSAFKNLRTFRKLCGRESMSSVIMATTMWDSESAAVGDKREVELKETAEWWGDMMREGSRVVRHSNDHHSAMNIISHLVDRNTTTVLGLQKEMVDEKRSLENTEAGREVESELVKERQRFERQLELTRKDMVEAIANNDKKHIEEIAKEQQKFEAKIQAIEKGREELHTTMEKLIAERERVHKEELAKYDQQLHESREARETLAGEIAEMKQLAKKQAAQMQRHQEQHEINVELLSVLALEAFKKQEEQAAKTQQNMAAEMRARESALKRKLEKEKELHERQMRMAADQAMIDRRREEQLRAEQQMFPSSPPPAYSPLSPGPAPGYPPYAGQPPYPPPFSPPPAPFMPMNPVVDYTGVVAAGAALGGVGLAGAALSACVVM